MKSEKELKRDRYITAVSFLIAFPASLFFTAQLGGEDKLIAFFMFFTIILIPHTIWSLTGPGYFSKFFK